VRRCLDEYVNALKTGVTKSRSGRGVGYLQVMVAVHIAVAPATLCYSSATIAGMLSMTMAPPYARWDSVQRMGTS